MTNRLTDRFSSDTSLWQILRHFESKPDGGGPNFTGREIQRSNINGQDSVGLFYQMPVIVIMSREFSSLVDLQKTLAQLGFNSGSTLLRLTFKTTDIPFEDAKQQISRFFSSDDTQQGSKDVDTKSPPTPQNPENGNTPPTVGTQAEEPVSTSSQPLQEAKDSLGGHESSALSRDEAPAQSIGNRPVTILAAPSSSTPQAAQIEFDEKDFVPTIEHAKTHQSRLSAAGLNKRLLSDAEIAAQVTEERRKREGIQEVKVKLRFPDQMQLLCSFGREDTANSLYQVVRGHLARESEPFMLNFSTNKGPKSIPQGAQGDMKLIEDLEMVGNILVNVIWGEGVSLKAKESPSMKEEFREKAQKIVIPVIEGKVEGDRQPVEPVQKPRDEKERKGGMPKWLKLPGKK